MKAKKLLNTHEIHKLIGIAFCQPKFYKRSVWAKAKGLMDTIACANQLAYPFDYGRGKGKYSCDGDIETVKEKVCEIMKKKGMVLLHNDFVLIDKDSTDPIVKIGEHYQITKTRNITITSTAGHEIKVPVFKDPVHMKNPNVTWQPFDDFICNRKIVDVVM